MCVCEGEVMDGQVDVHCACVLVYTHLLLRHSFCTLLVQTVPKMSKSHYAVLRTPNTPAIFLQESSSDPQLRVIYPLFPSHEYSIIEVIISERILYYRTIGEYLS